MHNPMIYVKSSNMSKKSENTTRCSMPTKFAILSFYSFLLIIRNSLVAMSVEVASSYDPTDILTLDCSSSDLPPPIDRNNIGSFHVPKTSFYVSKTQLSGYRQNPRPCHHKKQFTYTFSVSPGPKFIRLHFNPFTYSGYDISKALFSVTAAHFTLLKTSTVSYSKSWLNNGYTVKEYCINVDDEVLYVTFTPSPDVSAAYAFVNKIEVVSMPSNLYIREVSLPLIGVGQPSAYYINNSKALEMMHRLNIGGNLIPEQEDTGMFRQWIPDASFLMSSERNMDIITSDVQIKRSSIMPAYVSPEEVYASARTVVDHGLNQSATTWLLPVDSGFYYLVRLHFCEISKVIRGVDQRVFHVYIKDQTAEDHTDIFLWGNGAGIPVYRDYIVNFSGHAKRRRYLSLAIQNSNRSSKISKPAILNGLEIFKLSDFNNSLAGTLSYGMGKYSNPSRKGGGRISAVYFSVQIICIIFVLCGFLSLPVIISKGQGKRFLQSQSSHNCQSFTFDEVNLATNNFSDALLLGAGGYGNVYKGSINGGTVIVAIKRANPSSHQGLKEFETEILLLSRLRHCHLVSLIRYCREKKEMILVYDYMANGTLSDLLYKKQKPPLSWTRRLTICIGAARGLHYLHTGSKHSIIHRDVKSTNILLDQNWVAKVSDFGLSKIGPNVLTQSNTHVTTMVKGSFGYLDPEYYKRLKLTEKSDVYSFGVVLFEVLCARPAVLRGKEDLEEEIEKVNLAEWVLHCCQTGRVDEIIDPYLQGKIDPTCLETFIEIGRKCLGDKGSERPTMGEVLWKLEYAWKQQQESACFQNNGNCSVPDTIIADESSVIVDVHGVPQDGGSDPTPGLEFSEIISPIGR